MLSKYSGCLVLIALYGHDWTYRHGMPIYGGTYIHL